MDIKLFNFNFQNKQPLKMIKKKSYLYFMEFLHIILSHLTHNINSGLFEIILTIRQKYLKLSDFICLQKYFNRV